MKDLVENKSTFYAAKKTADETAFQARTDPHWVINLGATSHCTDNQSIFDDLVPCKEKLTTAGGFLQIMGKGNATIRLPNNSTARLGGVLFVPGIGTNLLSTQALLAQDIKCHQLVHRVDFYCEDKIAAKDSHKGKTSYLTWV